jgi:hypothetical protein
LLEKLVVPDNNRKLSAGLKLIHDFSVTAGLASFLTMISCILCYAQCQRSAHGL